MIIAVTENGRKVSRMSDLISRQAAIDVVKRFETNREITDIIEELPSAQPELSPCDVCRYNPPSSGDNKPCTICPAERRTNEANYYL